MSAKNYWQTWQTWQTWKNLAFLLRHSEQPALASSSDKPEGHGNASSLCVFVPSRLGGDSFEDRCGGSLTHGYDAVANSRAGRSSGGSTNAAVAVSIAAQNGTQPLASANDSQTSPPAITKIGRAQRFQMNTGIASR